MPLIILDRDGVINQDSDDYIKSLDEWQTLPGSISAIAQLSQAGFTIAVVTNQSGLGRGLFTLDDLESMHERLRELVEAAGGSIAGIFYCPHHPDDHCDCRKPKTGLFHVASEVLDQPLSGALAVGDSLRDLEAALTCNCQPVLVRTGKGTKTEQQLSKQANPALREIPVYDDLSSVVTRILSGKNL